MSKELNFVKQKKKKEINQFKKYLKLSFMEKVFSLEEILKLIYIYI